MSKFNVLFIFTSLVICFLFSFAAIAKQDDQQEATVWCERDCKMEYNFFRRYAQQGSSLANLSMAIMNYRGHGREIDIDAGNQLLLKAARKEEPVAMYQLGYFLLYGMYMEQNLERSLSWFKRAANFNMGNSKQMVDLVSKLLSGDHDNQTAMVNEILAASDQSAPGLYEQMPNSSNGIKVERITVVQSFDWSHALVIARQQTCKINCPPQWGYMLFPRIKSVSEEALLAALE